MPKALISGGAGFIGSHVVDRFLSAGYAVEVVDNLSTGRRENLRSGVRLHVMDITDPGAAKLVRDGGFAVLCHLAAQIDVRKSVADPRADAGVNILGTLNLLEAIQSLPEGKRPRVVFSSTGGALYGDATELPTSELAPANPDAPYGIAKLAAEYYLAYYGRVRGLESVVLRLGNVYGPRQDPHGEAGVVAIFGQRMLRGEPITIYGTGKQTRDYVYVGDVAEAFWAAATGPIPAPGALDARAFNIGTGVGTSVLELAQVIGDIVGRPAAPVFAPPRAGEVGASRLDARKAAAILRWHPTISIRDGLTRTIEWMSADRLVKS